MTKITDFLDKIPDEKPVRIFLPVIDSEENLRINCVLKKTEPPHFFLLFRSGTLPVNKIDVNSAVIITLDISGQTVSINAKIIEVLNGQTLNMVAQKSISHEQMREYFRVDCTLPVLLKSVIPESFDSEESKWKLSGTTVDLSGSGLRASFPEAPLKNKQVRMELALPTAVPSVVHILASPVRITKLTAKLWDAAYYFDDISDEDRDAIIGCCLVAQRRLLRLKVKVKDF